MQLVDWIILGVIVLSLGLGALLGFGRLLKIFTGGIIGIIISIVVTYFCLGIVASWGFVQDLMGKLLTAMQNADNAVVDFFIKIGVEKIILAVVLFFIIQLARILVVHIIKGIVEADNVAMKAINKTFGAVFMVAVACMITLIVFHVIDLIGGSAEEEFINNISGSLFKIDWIYEHNPLQYIIQQVVPAAAQ